MLIQLILKLLKDDISVSFHKKNELFIIGVSAYIRGEKATAEEKGYGIDLLRPELVDLRLA